MDIPIDEASLDSCILESLESKNIQGQKILIDISRTLVFEISSVGKLKMSHLKKSRNLMDSSLCGWTGLEIKKKSPCKE
jgi:DNA-directed RNA polymerase alpha subunit